MRSGLAMAGQSTDEHVVLQDLTPSDPHRLVTHDHSNLLRLCKLCAILYA